MRSVPTVPCLRQQPDLAARAARRICIQTFRKVINKILEPESCCGAVGIVRICADARASYWKDA